MSSAAAVPESRTPLVACARCGHRCTPDAWRRLPRLRTLSAGDLTECVSDWPTDVVVEVRACPGCSTPVARRAPAA